MADAVYMADGDRTSSTILVTQIYSVALLFDSACDHEWIALQSLHCWIEDWTFLIYHNNLKFKK